MIERFDQPLMFRPQQLQLFQQFQRTQPHQQLHPNRMRVLNTELVSSIRMPQDHTTQKDLAKDAFANALQQVDMKRFAVSRDCFSTRRSISVIGLLTFQNVKRCKTQNDIVTSLVYKKLCLNKSIRFQLFFWPFSL